MKYAVNSVIRIPSPTGFRVWMVTAILLGATGQESHYQLRPLDRIMGSSTESLESESLVPCDILNLHPNIQLV